MSSDAGSSEKPRADEVVCRLLLVAATTAFAGLAIFVVLGAAARYVLGAPFHFTEETVALLFLGGAFLAYPSSATGVEQIRMTILIGLVPQRFKALPELFNRLIVAAFSGWFGYAVATFAADAYELGTRTEQAEIPIWPWIALMAAGAGLSALISLVHLVRILRGQNEPRGAGTPMV
ncbi:MAG: TRAP transporter small permease [Flavobacteriaceae bacterium]